MRLPHSCVREADPSEVVGWWTWAAEPQCRTQAFLDLRGAKTLQAGAGLWGRPDVSGRPLLQRTGVGLPSRC